MTSPLNRLNVLLRDVYKSHSDEDIQLIWSKLSQILEDNSLGRLIGDSSKRDIWDSSTAVLITYPDAITSSDEPSLRTLANVINNKIGNLASVIHVLPFLRSTSDGGFSLSSHEELDIKYGEWNDLKFLGQDRIIMADLVLNHVSASHPWVDQFRKG